MRQKLTTNRERQKRESGKGDELRERVGKRPKVDNIQDDSRYYTEIC